MIWPCFLLLWLRRSFAWQERLSRRNMMMAVSSVSLLSSTAAARALSPENAAQQYDQIGSSYDNVKGVADSLGLDDARASLLQHARGNVLEIGVGTFQNSIYYDFGGAVETLTAVDISENMLTVARQKASTIPSSSKIQFVRADATSELVERFGRGRFDTVVDTFSLCVMGDTLALECLRQLKQVVKPEGQILLLENSRSSNNLLGLYQDLTVDLTSRTGGRGCQYNQDVSKLIRYAGLTIQSETEYVSGLFRAYRCVV